MAVGVLATPAPAQQWTGSASVGVAGGHQTNAYLDPVLNSWDLTSESAFAALTPRVGLVRNARRTRLDLTGHARLYPRRQDVPQFAQGNARIRYRLSSNWTVGALGGGTRYRFASSRDTWWTLSGIGWSPTALSTLWLRAGYTQRYVITSQGTDRQPSTLVSLRAAGWFTDRLQVEGRLFWSSGRTSTANAEFGGAGGGVRTTFWPTNFWSVGANVAVEQLQYEQGNGSTVRDHIGRAGIETQWQVNPSTTVFANARGLGARLTQGEDVATDVHVSAGIRVGIQGVLGGTAPAPAQRRVCVDVENGTKVQIPYDGPGTVHVTGDFNGWSTPGIAMQETHDGEWTAVLDVPPGTFSYRFRVVTDDGARWLDLPSYARTAADAFGGTNGVCTTH